MVILSDLHIGYIPEGSRESFQEILLEELRSLANQTQVHYLVVTGDFAWKNQSADLPRAAVFMTELRYCLGVTDASQFHFCPGNHDASLVDDNPWKYYHGFVEQLAASDPKLRNRFYSYQERAKTLQTFEGRRSTLAVSRGKQDSVLFAALNSCRVRKENEIVITEPEVGERQWMGLRKLLEGEPCEQLRIAIVHHPLFAAPGGDFPDERPMYDQAKALHQLGALGFRLVLHGHSHFSAVYEHRVAALNEGGSGTPTRLCIISCPTCGAEPSNSTPLRQYLILSVGPGEANKETRSLSLRSRFYNQRKRVWEEGTYVEDHIFEI